MSDYNNYQNRSNYQGYQNSSAAYAGQRATTPAQAPNPRGMGKHGRPKKRWPKVLLGIVIAIIVLIGVVVGVAVWYMSTLNSAMSLGENTEEIKAKLVQPEEDKDQ